jgi:hypothetical protein
MNESNLVGVIFKVKFSNNIFKITEKKSETVKVEWKEFNKKMETFYSLKTVLEYFNEGTWTELN